MAREVRPAAIILDIIMPDLDGWSVLHSLKTDDALSEIPVILVTVLADRDMGLALGAADYLTKPVDTRQLLKTLRRVRVGNDGTDVLVVDDDRATRDVLRRTLAREGWRVREAGDGEQGLEQLERARPALVLLDLMMPGMDGFGMLRAKIGRAHV